jgi:hypothetical protein
MNSSRIKAVNERGVSTGRRENLVVRDGEVKLFADRLRQEHDLVFGVEAFMMSLPPLLDRRRL